MTKKTFLKAFFYLSTFCILSIYFSNDVIKKNAQEKVFSKTEKIPKNKVGVVLGTSKHLKDGRINLYYKYRLDAAIKLYNSNPLCIMI